MSIWMADDLGRINSIGIGLSRFSPAFQKAMLQVQLAQPSVVSSRTPLESKNHDILSTITPVFSVISSASPSIELSEPFSVSVVDTGCQRTAIGIKALQAIAQQLPTGLSIKLEEQQFRFRGVGGEVITTHVACIPVCFGTRPGMIRAAVLHHSPEAPFLISLPILKTLGSKIDLQKESISFCNINEQGSLKYNGRNQLCLDLFDFQRISSENQSKEVWKPKVIIDDECFIFTMTVSSKSDAVVHNHPDCISQGRKYYENSIGDRLVQSNGLSTLPNVEIPAPHIVPSTRLRTYPVSVDSISVRSACHGDRPKDHEAYGCRGSITTSSEAASGQPVEAFVHSIDLSQPVDEHTTHHDQSGFSRGDVHESCSSSPDTLWCRGGRSAVNSRNTEPDNHRRTESDPSSPSCESQTQEGQEGQEGETTGDTSNGQDQSGKLRDDQQLYGSQEDRQQQSSNDDPARAGPTGDVLLRHDSNGIYMLQAGAKLDETFSSLSQSTGCPVPIFCLAGGREINWISTASTSQQLTGQTCQFSSRSSDSKFEQFQRLRGILQERRQQRERSTGFASPSKSRTSRCQLKSEVQPSMVTSGNQCPCQDEDLQNLQSSRDHPFENGSSDSGLSHRQQFKQEVDQKIVTGLEAQQLPSGTRKRILGELKSLIDKLEKDTIPFESTDIANEDVTDIMHLRLIGEVFSTPQFSRRATKHGLQPGRAFDLQLGDQFLDPEHRSSCLEHLRNKRYGLVTVSCPCTMFTNLQFMARGRSRESCMQDPLFQKKLREAIVLLNFGFR